MERGAGWQVPSWLSDRRAIGCRLLLSTCLMFLCGLAPAEPAASIVFASGSPQVIGVDGQPRAAVRGSELGSGETIDTGDGRVQLRFRDGASMSLQPATRFRVDDYRYSGEDGRAGADDKGFFSLLKGGLRTISGLIGKGRREQYRVETVVATIGIRGTGYGANLTDDGLRVTTFVGLVEVCNRGGCQLVRPGETALADSPDRKPRLLDSSLALPGSADMVPQLSAPANQQEIPVTGHSAPPTTLPSAPSPSPPPVATSPPSGYSPPASTYSPPLR